MWNLIAEAAPTLLGGFVTQMGNNRAADIAAESQRYAADVAARAQVQAANMVAQGQHQAALVYVDAVNKQLEALEMAIDEVRSGNEAAVEQLQQIRIETNPAMMYMRDTIAQDGRLTPQQRDALRETRRTVSNMIRGSGFAGSGRTAAGLIRQAETDTVNSMMEANRNRAFQAASTLAGQNMAAGRDIANTQSRTGAQVGQFMSQAGQAHTQGADRVAGTITGAANAQGQAAQNAGQLQGNAAIAAGNAQANAATANAENWGESIGEIGSIIANQQRESKFQNRMSAYEKSIKL